MNLNERYQQQLKELKQKYIRSIEKEIRRMIQKTNPSQFDDKYMDPKIKVLIRDYKEELDVLNEQIMQDILKEKHKHTRNVQALKTAIHETKESNQEIEDFYREHNYPYTPFCVTDSDVFNPLDIEPALNDDNEENLHVVSMDTKTYGHGNYSVPPTEE